MQLQLTVISGPELGQVFEVETGEQTLIGRGPESEIRLSDPRISRTHCRIHVDGGKITLRDAASRWGTLVNGKPVQKQRLMPGDVITLGETELKFDLVSDGTATTLVPRPRALAETIDENQGDKEVADPRADVTDRQTPPPDNVTGDRPDTDAPDQGKGASQLPAALNQLVGTELHRYKIVEEIARGRGGRIFRAQDSERDRTVALKVLRPELVQQEGELQRFQRAIQSVQKIRHDNLVTLYAAGRSRGLCWMAMEFVDGPSAADLIRKIGIAGMIDWMQALRIAVHIAQALEAIYDERIIHRNIAPETILLQTEDRKAKLGGLLLAKALDESQSERISIAGQLIGKIAYLPPEQINDSPNIDHRADIYSLGATIYALLTGHPPCEGNTPSEVLQNIQGRKPQPPTEAQLAIPPMFEGVVLRMLNKRPEDRYENPAILVRELRRVAKFHNMEID